MSVFPEFCDEYYSKLSSWVLGGSFWPYSREYLSQQYLSSTGSPVPSQAVNAVVPADSGTLTQVLVVNYYINLVSAEVTLKYKHI